MNLEKINGDVAQADLPSAHGIVLLQDSAAPHQQLPASCGPAGDLPWSAVTCVRAWRELGIGRLVQPPF